MSTSATIVKNTGYLYGKMAITMFMSLYTTRLILNGLGEKDFGVFNIVGGTIAMLSFLSGPMAQATQRFLNYYEGDDQIEKLKTVFNTSFFLNTCIGIIICLFLEIAYFFIFDSVLSIPEESILAAKWVYQFTVISTLFTIISVPYEASLNAHENMFYFSVVGIIESVLKLGTALYVVQTGYDKLIIYGLLMATISFVKVFMMRLYCVKNYSETNLNVRKYFNKKMVKEMTSFAGWSFIGSIANLASSQGSAIVMNNFFGVRVNAAQGVANQLSGQLMSFSNNLIKALNPVIVKREGASDRNKMLEATLTGSKLSFLIMAFFFCSFMIKMPYILSLWLKTPPEYAIIFCRLLLIRMLFNQLGVTFGTAIGAVGKVKGITLSYTVLTFLVLPICYLFFKLGFDATTFYYIYLFADFILLGISVFFMKKLCGMSIKFFIIDVFIKCISITLIILSVSYTIISNIDNSLLQFIYILMVSSSLLVFGGYFFVMNRTEKQVLLNLKSKLFTWFLNKRKQ